MPPTTIREAPKEDTFTSLAEHQAQTPSTFYDAKPVLHYQKNGIRAIASVDQISKLPILAASEVENGATTVQTLDVWISSENLTLYNPTISTGMSIPYPSISLHAISRLSDPSNPSTEIQGLYMQLDLSDPNSNTGEDEEMDDIIELTLLTSPSSEDETPEQAIQKMFDAVSNCSNLHPDPMDEDDEDMAGAAGDSRIRFEGSVGYEGISGLPGVQQGVGDGGLPPPFPGSGGWITADNVNEYFDAEGNWIGGGDGEGEGVEVLGEGAGRTRTRDEVDGPGHGERVNGNNADADESKRPRTE
ncbi:hypothetical protein VTL71DRAFT_1179 [Oculimacula yallundae]|uniref:Uncharacterized protein n=1 Tax=Oculimacula yallundae TaxID=86028 RepID=A0ABR4D384_9HELO